MLMGLLIHWLARDQPRYPSMEPYQSIPFISDVGAFQLKPLFIAGSCVTTLFLDLSFISERWLRHRGRLARNLTTTEKVLSVLGFLFALLGTSGLILLSIFDSYHYSTLHNVFLLLFMAGYIFSAIFICWEYQRLGIHYREHRILRVSFWVKLSFILLEICLAIAFAACGIRDDTANVAVCLEWAIAFTFTFYILSFFIDLLPAAFTKRMACQFENGGEATEMEAGHNDYSASGRGGIDIGAANNGRVVSMA
ncbi:Frag1/DRAM/Sfk1 family-domain-containing protein [Bisporella sp. PMI_857]|nr:Frag1/DRAM/Sfk1 family-domain-containing protein [Bisporella sp. PMI_857]